MRAFLVVLLLLLAAACPRSGKEAPAPVAEPPPATPKESSPFPAQPPGKRVVILYTASVQGYVEPCGCTADPLGGVARLGAAVEAAKQAWGERVLFIDGGDLLFERPDDDAAADACQAEARAELLIASYARFGLAGTVLGPLDDVRGPAFRDARLAAHQVPTLGVNTPRELVNGAPAAPSLLRSLGEAKVGVTAFRVDGPDQVTAAHEALLAEVHKLRSGGAEAIVVLAQAPREVTKRVVTNIPGIDVVIQARKPGEVPAAPEQITGGPVIVAAGQQAQHLGVLELVLDGRGPEQLLALDDRQQQAEHREKVLMVRISELERQVTDTPDGPRKVFLVERLATAQTELLALRTLDPTKPLTVPHVVARALPLPRGFPEEPKAAQALAGYTESIPALVASCEANLVCPAPPPGARTYVGAASCKACHASAFTFWQAQVVKRPGKDDDGNAIVRELGHARAWETLTRDGKDKDRSCVGCHSVGFGKPGGACRTTDIVKQGLQGVQCESCHGAGSAHVVTGAKADIVRMPDEAVCRSCHQVPHIPTTESFQFFDRLKLITGPGHGAPAP